MSKITLRELKQKDIPNMLEWMQDKESRNFFRFSSDAATYENALNFVQNAQIQLMDGKSIHFAITDASDEYLGTISLKNIDLQSKNAEYAIALRKKARGKGIGHDATCKILQMAFEQFGLERVYLNVLSKNQQAIYLYEKMGFVYEGEFRNHLFLNEEFQSLKWYGMLKEEYYKRK